MVETILLAFTLGNRIREDFVTIPIPSPQDFKAPRLGAHAVVAERHAQPAAFRVPPEKCLGPKQKGKIGADPQLALPPSGGELICVWGGGRILELRS